MTVSGSTITTGHEKCPFELEHPAFGMVGVDEGQGGTTTVSLFSRAGILKKGIAGIQRENLG